MRAFNRNTRLFFLKKFRLQFFRSGYTPLWRVFKRSVTLTSF